MGMGAVIRNRMARRAAEEILDGMTVNLGIGIPSLVPNHLPEERKVMFHAENGIIGMGPSPPAGEEDENLCNAGGFPVTLKTGGAYFDSSVSFAMIRRGRIDLTVLGALEVSRKGDLANWIVPGKKVPGMGGAMELAQKAKKVIALMSHCDKQGNSKIVPFCTLPLTTKGCINLIITDLAVFRVEETGLLLTEIFTPFDLMSVIQKTQCDLMVSKTIRRIPY